MFLLALNSDALCWLSQSVILYGLPSLESLGMYRSTNKLSQSGTPMFEIYCCKSVGSSIWLLYCHWSSVSPQTPACLSHRDLLVANVL